MLQLFSLHRTQKQRYGKQQFHFFVQLKKLVSCFSVNSEIRFQMKNEKDILRHFWRRRGRKNYTHICIVVNLVSKSTSTLSRFWSFNDGFKITTTARKSCISSFYEVITQSTWVKVVKRIKLKKTKLVVKRTLILYFEANSTVSFMVDEGQRSYGILVQTSTTSMCHHPPLHLNILTYFPLNLSKPSNKPQNQIQLLIP